MKTLSIIGGGWRTECWIKVIHKLKSDYLLDTVYCRNREKAQRIALSYGVNVDCDYKNVYNKQNDIVIVCVQKAFNERISDELARNGINVLCETPFSSENVENKDKILVAEQYAMQPRFVALKKIIDSGILGKVHTVELSCCHNYHAISVLRFLLSIGNEMPIDIKNIVLNDAYEELYFRYGKIPQEIKEYKRYISFLTYGEKTAIYDFSEGQYFSPIRRHKIAVYGEKGEIIDDTGSCIQGGEVRPITIEALYNGTKGDLFPLSLNSICCNGEEVYKNPYGYIGLSEEEIAMAECLKESLGYFENKQGGYSVEKANIDYITSKMIME